MVELSLEELANTHFAEEISLLCTIPGVKTFSALCIIAEIGIDMSTFRKANHLVGWAGLRPRNDETAQERIETTRQKISFAQKYIISRLVDEVFDVLFVIKLYFRQVKYISNNAG